MTRNASPAHSGLPSTPAAAPGLGLTAGEFCTRSVVFTDRGMLLDAAARLMRTRHVGSLVVVEERSPGERIVVGMLTAPSFMTASMDSQSSTWLPSITTTASPRVTP